jgi:hypothetical protein
VRVVGTATHKPFWMRRKSLQHPSNRNDDEPQNHCLPSRGDKSLAATLLVPQICPALQRAACPLNRLQQTVSCARQTLTSQVNKEISNLFQHCGFTSFNVELLSSPQLCEVCGSHSALSKGSVLLGCYAVLLGKYFVTFRKMP